MNPTFERNVEILNRINNGEKRTDIAADLGISVTRVSQSAINARIILDRNGRISNGTATDRDLLQAFLKFNTAASNAIFRSQRYTGIKTVSDLIKFYQQDKEQLMKIRNVGTKVFQHIENCINEYLEENEDENSNGDNSKD